MVRPGDRRARARSGHHRADRAEPAQRHARPPEEGAAGRGGERLALEPVPAGGVQERHRDVRAGRQAAAAHGHAGAVDVADPEVHLRSEVVSAWPSSRSRLAASRSVTVTSVLAGRPLPLTVTPEQSTLRIPRYISDLRW